MITHCPTNGKLRTIPSSDGLIPMIFHADGDGGGEWIGTVAGGEIRVRPGVEDDHVAVMQAAIEEALAKPIAKAGKAKPK